MNTFNLERDAAGRLTLIDAQGLRHAGVVPVRAFPISAPEAGISLVGEDGHELSWIDRLDTLDDGTRELIEAELAQREFMPEILAIEQVSSFATPSRWQVRTDRGDTELLLKTEDNIRRLGPQMLLIADGHGVSFIIKDISRMDHHSRRMLDRFL
jgi:hypothetical protein